MKKALLIIDMSNDFVHDNGNLSVKKPAQDIVPYIVNKAQEFLDNGDFVFFCMDQHKDGIDHNWPPHNATGTWGAELYGELKEWYDKNKTNKKIIFVPKESYDSFKNTSLMFHLRFLNGIKDVHLTGVCTDICIFNTAAGAFDNNLEITIHKDGVATFSPFGETALKMMEMQFNTKII